MKMKKLIKVSILFALTLFIANNTILAQRGGGWGHDSKYSKMFNPQTVETLTGTVVAVERIIPEAKMTYGLYLLVKTKTTTISVHLGPTWYLDNQEIQFSKGDKVTVTGSKIIYQNAPAIIAMEVTQGENVLLLRNRNGYPSWQGWRNKGKGQQTN